MSTLWLTGTIRPAAGAGIGEGPIVKLGGSLLTRPAWPEDVRRLLASLRSPVVVVGGGPVVDGLREIDAASPRSTALMHDLAIDAMRLTARIVAEALRLPLEPRVESHAVTPIILDTATWLGASSRVHPLPQGWQVTSDSIAAIIAASAGRDLLLVKSLPPHCPGDALADLSAAGWVDEHFPAAAADVTAIGWAAPA